YEENICEQHADSFLKQFSPLRRLEHGAADHTFQWRLDGNVRAAKSQIQAVRDEVHLVGDRLMIEPVIVGVDRVAIPMPHQNLHGGKRNELLDIPHLAPPLKTSVCPLN